MSLCVPTSTLFSPKISPTQKSCMEKENLKNELFRNRTDMMKRSSSPNMDEVDPELTQTHKPENKEKRCKSSSSSDCRTIAENPPESITSHGDSSSRKTKKIIGRFFYENGLDTNAINSLSFDRMISRLQMKNHVFPTPHELKGWIFEDILRETRYRVDEIKKTWAHTGCSILLDGWTDQMGRHLVNILADCPGGTVYLGSCDISNCLSKTEAMLLFLDRVITKVGIKNIVQIITYSASAFMKEVGKQLMEKYRPIFWTTSASSCMELILEKLGQMDLIKETLEDAKVITRSAHSRSGCGPLLVKLAKRKSALPFMTLENIVLKKQVLKDIFDSILTVDRAAELVRRPLFWSRASNIMKGSMPIVLMIEWMEMNTCSNKQVPIIYETINQTKDYIKEEFDYDKSQYEMFCRVIDDVWNEFLYSPLHSAGYFLNPTLFYSEDVTNLPEVFIGLLCCIVRSTKDLGLRDKIIIQLEKYRFAKGAFGDGCVNEEDLKKNTPAYWWSKYGGDCPELQKLAIRILSQTCSGASRFQLKRSVAETLLTKGRNKAEQKRLADMVFLQYNMQLQNFDSGKTECITWDGIDSVNDWLVGKEDEDDDVSENGGVIWMDLDGRDGADRTAIDLEGVFGGDAVDQDAIGLEGGSGGDEDAADRTVIDLEGGVPVEMKKMKIGLGVCPKVETFV